MKTILLAAVMLVGCGYTMPKPVGPGERASVSCVDELLTCKTAMEYMCSHRGYETVTIASHYGIPLRPYHDPIGGLSWLDDDEPREEAGKIYYRVTVTCR